MDRRTKSRQPDENEEHEVFCMIPNLNQRQVVEEEDVFCMIPNPESHQFEDEVHSGEDEYLASRVNTVYLVEAREEYSDFDSRFNTANLQEEREEYSDFDSRVNTANLQEEREEYSDFDSRVNTANLQEEEEEYSDNCVRSSEEAEHEDAEDSLYKGLDLEEDIPGNSMIKSDYKELEDLFDAHKDSIYADCLAVYERLPTVEEFFDEFYLKYIQPYSWSGWWIKHQWDRKTWPVPKKLQHPTVVRVKNFDKRSMKYQIIPKEPEEFIGDPDNKATNLWVPVHELECSKCINDEFKYFQTFKRAHSLYLRFKLFLLLPNQKGMTAEDWFLFAKVQSIDLQFDLSYDGAICPKLKKEIIDTFCSIKEKEELLLQYEAESELSADKFQTITCLNVDIDTLTLRLKFLSDPVVRPCLEANVVQTGLDYCEGLEESDLVIVLDLGRPYDLGLLRSLQIRAAQFLTRAGFTEHEAMTKPFRIVPTLYGAVNKCADGAIIFLGPGRHELPGIGNLCRGGSIIGLPINQSEDGKVKVVASGVGDVWFLFEQSEANHLYEFADIEFLIEADVLSCQYTYAFCVLGGQLVLTDCVIKHINSPKRSVVHVETNAIKISGPARLQLHRAKIDTFGCGLIIDGNVDLDINTCLLNACNGAMKINNHWGNVNVVGLLLANCNPACRNEIKLPNMKASEAYDCATESLSPENTGSFNESATNAVDAGPGKIIVLHAAGFVYPPEDDVSDTDNACSVNVSPASGPKRTHTV